ncbi:MAG: flagellar hook-basal body complex protein, partial [Lachnospiraceae bacterium]|nr:flagellar hook-basal body complex protein [Lachnospiraceae bacterium]
MMRSLFSGVAGLRTHQTRMDVIGNNIANVNTTAYKSQNMVFSDLLYQTTQAASGANNNGRGGINPRQIGLGAKTGAISTAITTQGSAQSTNNPWDVMIEGDSFFIVNNGSENFFTRDGSFTIDGAGNLVMANTGFKVMGWQVDPQTGDIMPDAVSALQVMHPDNLNSAPEASSLAYVSGILDKKDPTINSTAGAIRTFQIFDAQGYAYTVKMSFHGIGSEDEFRVQLDDILDSTGVSLVTRYNLNDISQIATFGADKSDSTTALYSADSAAKPPTGQTTFTDTFNVELAFSNILNGYSDNALIVAAGKNVTIEAPRDGDEVQKDGEVTLKGSVTLNRAQLESEPYNLIYVDGKYYTKAGEDSTANKEVTDTDWPATLKSLVTGVDNVTVTPVPDGAAGEMKIDFEAKFTATQAATRNGNAFGITLKMPDDEKEILKQVYHLEDGDGKTYKIDFIAPNGAAQITEQVQSKGTSLVFDHDTGYFSYVGNAGSNTATLNFNSFASS